MNALISTNAPLVVRSQARKLGMSGGSCIPANSVAQYGTGFLDAVRDGRVAPVAPAAGGGGQGGTDRVLAPAVLNSENEFRRFMESHKGRAIVLNHLDGAGRLMLGGRA